MTFSLPLISHTSVIATALIVVALDCFISRELYNRVYSSYFPSYTIVIPNDTTHTKNTKKPALLIDTNPLFTNKDRNPISTGNRSHHMIVASPESIHPTALHKPVKKRRHYSVSSRSEIDFSYKMPELSPSASSDSSFDSNWSQGRRPSQVEEMIHLFETGGYQPHRRYSVDSHNYQQKQLIRERKFEYKPIAIEWKKRDTNPIQLTPSKST
ncbi:hypothetical protein INT47_010780 [Mucor saturninus]|uniref:Uncharacterized protein n=1 Tax=Mucor saturninus TaxID=64648 RepID=A0A8H7QQD5_9FUNG|nr:hypothetical protein INT47_010780 [Mucor saturninus]